MTPYAADTGARALARRHVLFGVYSLCVSVAYLPVLSRLFAYSRENMAASHVVLIPFVAMALIYLRRESIFSPVRRAGDVGAGVILAGLGLLLAAAWHGPFGRGTLTLMVGALVALWIGGFLLFYGRQAFRAALFP